MKDIQVLNITEQWIRTKFSQDTTGHDFWHIMRVVKLAEKIAKSEEADPFICQMAAYLHDVADEKIVEDTKAADREVMTFLHSVGLHEENIQQIWMAIQNVSFKGNHVVPTTLEGKVVQDADRLDAIGAIGIARTFSYGGSAGHKMYDPDLPQIPSNINYRDHNKTSIQHFYEKLLKLRELMNTKTAQEIAKKRHQFMVEYLEQFYLEWDGADH